MDSFWCDIYIVDIYKVLSAPEPTHPSNNFLLEYYWYLIIEHKGEYQSPTDFLLYLFYIPNPSL